MEFGRIVFSVDEYMKKRNISRNSLSRNAQITYRQVLNLCDNKVERIDLYVLARVCTALDCKLEDIMTFVPK
jgi:putative transcriptional regulator